MARRRNDDGLELVRQAIVEFIGPFALMFIGGGAIIVTEGQNLLAIALAHGIAIATMVAAAGHLSGGVYNPALTVGLVVTGRMPVNRGGVYVIAQCAGAIAAALALTAIFDKSQVDLVNLGLPAVGERYEVAAALFAEIIATFFLMYAVFGTAVDPRGAKPIAALVIGLVITIDILAIGAVSGAAMNPARAIGPAVVQGDFGDQWIYWVGPVVGAVVAALLFEFLMRSKITPEAGDVEVVPTTARREVAEPRTAARRRRR